MSYAVLLLCLVLIGAATSESTTKNPDADKVLILPKEPKPSPEKPVVIREDNSTGPEEEADGEDDSLESAESQDRFTFTRADAINKPWAKADVEDDEGDGPDGDAADEDAKILEELTALVASGIELMNDTANDPDVKVTKINEQDIDSDEDGEEEGIPSDDEEEKEETADATPEESQIKRQDDRNFNENRATRLDFEEPNRQGEIPAPPADEYVTVNDQPGNSNSENDNSPLLQLTQGGYRPLFQGGYRQPESPRVRTQSASQQSETVENPASNVNNDNQFRQPQVSPQVSYADPFQGQFGFTSALGLRHPFIPPDSFVNSNGMVHQPVQNGFFNVPPAGFTDFTGANFQAPFSPANDGGYQVLPRTPSGISLFQAPPEHNPGYMVQNQQFPQNQFVATDPSQALYQSPGFMNYPGSEQANAAPRPDYSPFFRSPSQFQANNNPFAAPRNPAGVLYNPMMQFQPNFIGRPQYSPQYPASNQQVQVQSTPPEERKKKDLDKIKEGETTNTEEQVNALPPNKEDTSSVPYGSRILRQNIPELPADFPPQADVFMRYPVKEAGYATEESLPVQNTTTKTETKKEPSPPRQIYSIFQSPEQLGDPYRNALRAVQQGFAADSNVRKEDDGNRTKQAQSERIPPRMAFPFSPMARPIPGYPDSRNLSPVPMRPPSPFFRSVDGPVDDPFGQLGAFPEQFPVPVQTGSQSQEVPTLPACVHGQANASMCFEDPEYPKRDVMFSLNSDPYLMERFYMPDQQLDTIGLVEQEAEHPESPADYICDSKIKYGYPLRAKDVDGQWKVIVNIQKDVGQGRFIQPVRLEVCKGAGDPCNFTQVKTACVQKYNLHRLLAWSPEKGVHNDVFKLPVACACQVIDAKA